MENKEYFNEENYQKSNIKVKKTGKILLIVGIILLLVSVILIVLGFAGFGNAASNTASSFENDFFGTSGLQDTTSSVFKNIGLFAFGGFVNMLGFILTIAGAIMLFMSHRREIAAYTMQQAMPLAKEGIEKMTPTVATSAGAIAESISQGIKKGKDKE